MNGRLPLGSYRPGASSLHRLDARVKLVCLVAMSAALLAASNPVALGALAVAVAELLRISGVTPKELAVGVRPAAFLLVFGLVANAFAPAATAELALGPVSISLAGLGRGAILALRMVAVIAASLVLCAATSPTSIAEALSSLLSPLARLGLPVDDISMTLSLVLRFVPIAAEEFGRIQDAQLARGASFAHGGAWGRVRRWGATLVPLVVGLFRRSTELAGAMRERGWGMGNRTRLSRKLNSADIMVLVLCLAACLAAIFV